MGSDVPAFSSCSRCGELFRPVQDETDCSVCRAWEGKPDLEHLRPKPPEPPPPSAIPSASEPPAPPWECPLCRHPNAGTSKYCLCCGNPLVDEADPFEHESHERWRREKQLDTGILAFFCLLTLFIMVFLPGILAFLPISLIVFVLWFGALFSMRRPIITGRCVSCHESHSERVPKENRFAFNCRSCQQRLLANIDAGGNVVVEAMASRAAS